jgi:hypothetical protein
MALRDQPYLPLYVQDFLSDEKLMECSASATGIYIRLMCIMHKSEQYGKICYNKTSNKNLTAADFARKLERFLPYSYKEIITGIEELLENCVLVIEGCALCQKRMIRDNEISIKRRESGRKGMRNRYSIHRENNKKSAGKDKKICYNKTSNKNLTNSENENEYEYEVENINSLEKGVTGEKTENGESEKSLQEFAGSKPPNVENSCTEGEDCAVLEELSFENVWVMYGRKGNRKSSQRRWDGLPKKAKLLAVVHIPRYVAATPEIRYRKNFETYINQEVWNDQIITRNESRVTKNAGSVGSGHSGNGANTFRTDAEKRRHERQMLAQMAATVLQQPET